MSSALPPSSAPPPASSVPATTRFFTASSAAPSTTEIATSVVTITPSATRSGETPTPIAVISVFTLDSLPVSCSSRWVLYISSGSTVITSGNYAGTVPTGSVSSGYWQSCYPNAPKNPLYSPAICTGQTSVNTIKSAIEGTGSTAATVWSGICCPSGMSYFGRCERAFTTPFTALSPMPIVVTISAESDASLSTDLGWETVTAGRTIRSETVLSSGTLFAEPVTVLWKSSDLSNFPTAYATALAAEMGVMISAEPPPTMSAGAKAGIAVGAVLGLISLFSAIVYYCMRKRRTARQQQNLQDGMAEMPGQSTGLKRMFGGRWRAEMDGGGRWRAEMDGGSRPTEIDSRRVHVVSGPLAELEAPHHERDEDFAIPKGHR